MLHIDNLTLEDLEKLPERTYVQAYTYEFSYGNVSSVIFLKVEPDRWIITPFQREDGNYHHGALLTEKEAYIMLIESYKKQIEHYQSRLDKTEKEYNEKFNATT